MARLFDSIQFCKIAKITRPTMNKWQKMGLIPRRTIGNAYYFLQEDINLVPRIKDHMKANMQSGYKMRKDLK